MTALADVGDSGDGVFFFHTFVHYVRRSFVLVFLRSSISTLFTFACEGGLGDGCVQTKSTPKQ